MPKLIRPDVDPTFHDSRSTCRITFARPSGNGPWKFVVFYSSHPFREKVRSLLFRLKLGSILPSKWDSLDTVELEVPPA
jgi:hypothetical protein